MVGSAYPTVESYFPMGWRQFMWEVSILARHACKTYRARVSEKVLARAGTAEQCFVEAVELRWQHGTERTSSLSCPRTREFRVDGRRNAAPRTRPDTGHQFEGDVYLFPFWTSDKD